MAEVRANAGVPVAAQFFGVGAPTMCAPIVVDSLTGFIYTLKTGDVVVAAGASGTGTVTSVAFTGGLISVANPTTAAALTVAGTSGGIPYFSGAATWASSGALTASALVLGGGAGEAPTVLGSLGTTTTVLHGNAAGAPTFAAVSLTADVSGTLPVANGGTGITALGTGVATALGVNVGSAGAFVTLNGAGGTPSSIVLTNATGTAAGLTAGVASAVALGGITGLGTNVATALAVAVGSAGAFVTFNGALGTPSSGTLTNATGLPEGGLTLADNTTNNVSTTKHGLVPKAPNVATQYLDGTGAYSTPAGTGAGSLIYIATAAASASAAIDFTSGITSTYDEYLVTLTNIVPATDNAALWFRVSEDGGSTFKAGATDYSWARNGESEGSVDQAAGSAGDVKILLGSPNISSTAGNGGLCGELRFFAPAGTTQHKLVTYQIGFPKTSAADFYIFTGAGRFILDTNAINAVRFLMSTGNITSGTFTLYGVKKT